MEAANRAVIADKEKLATDLYDERNVNDSLRTRVRSLEGEMTAKNELIGNYRRESELSEGISRATQDALATMAKTNLAAPAVVGPKLPPALDSALKRFADEHPSEVSYDPARGSVKWKADLLFPLGSDVVKESSLDGLRGFAEILKSPAAADFEVVVAGHTDNRPIVRAETKAAHPTNWHLSAHRAIAVSNVLQKSAVPANRIGVMGCSEYRPITENDNETGNSQNRRVEIYMVPIGSIVHGGFSTSAPRTQDASAAVRRGP
jgi:flagellar motor protein MotB